MVTNCNLNLNIEDNKWLEKFNNEKEAQDHVKKLIDIGNIVYNFTKHSINFDNDLFDPIKIEMNKLSNENFTKTELINKEIMIAMDDMKLCINKIVGGTNNSCIKGKIGENIIEEIIHNNFPEDILINTSKKARESDYQFITNHETILIEIKTYNEKVGTCQVDKFKNDMIRCGNKLGIFYSSTSGIVGIKNIIHLEKINNNQSILFVPNGGIEGSTIIQCISFCKILLKKNYDNNCVIDYDLLQKYFDEFQNTYTEISKISYEINKTKKNIENILDDLYKKSINLELKSKYLIEESQKKFNKIIINTHLNNQLYDDNINIFIENLRVNNDNRLINFLSITKLLEKYNYKIRFSDNNFDKLLIQKDNIIIGEIKICKTKMNFIIKEPQLNILIDKDSFKFIEFFINNLKSI